MKQPLFFISILLVTVLVSCSKNLSDTTDSIPDMLPPIDTTSTKILYEGRFENGPFGTTSGKVSILQSGAKFQLRLDSFRVSNGPDLKVYISKQKLPLDFYRVGSLQAFQGGQLYDLGFKPAFPEFSYVLIHCEKFNHLFGSALLMEK